MNGCCKVGAVQITEIQVYRGVERSGIEVERRGNKGIGGK